MSNQLEVLLPNGEKDELTPIIQECADIVERISESSELQGLIRIREIVKAHPELLELDGGIYPKSVKVYRKVDGII